MQFFRETVSLSLSLLAGPGVQLSIQRPKIIDLERELSVLESS